MWDGVWAEIGLASLGTREVLYYFMYIYILARVVATLPPSPCRFIFLQGIALAVGLQMPVHYLDSSSQHHLLERTISPRYSSVRRRELILYCGHRYCQPLGA